ncbi:Ger(x)C family spore germination C-terminal domain-containing protein [Alicyclobacillus fastidiosus]|uniref:Ger(x)C family spore germination C-terminal domain-containing protein n=1 Tax=Alicyclobacillus fastidiosus TaxID=392011 RepID=UPI0023B87726|nr:Ger(x)C family spore germination C-terminal domain-containing protein [Alicyclobacillus fastidiosus]WEH10048.1 Ger(x)C family spore germination C-terminal domain-containing protein [Alicyclobacillus fastidiosus]WEH10072.1 Ger(x)C family spore germination C-terminal domain-containing protein [Alicyclobacillus fastidiosus]
MGRLSDDEATGLRWFLPYLPRAIVTLDRRGDSIATVVFNSHRYRVRPVIIRGSLKFDVQVKVGGVIDQMGQSVSEAQVKSMVAQKIEKDIRKTYDKGLRFGVDIYSLADSLYRRNPKAFHRFVTNDGHVKLSEDSLQRIQVEVTIKDAGKLTKPATRFTS